MDADDDAVADAGESAGVADGDLALDVEGLHGVTGETNGEGGGVADVEGDVLAGKATGAGGGGQEEGVALGQEGDQGDARGVGGGGYRRGRAGRRRSGWKEFFFEAFDELDEGF